MPLGIVNDLSHVNSIGRPSLAITRAAIALTPTIKKHTKLIQKLAKNVHVIRIGSIKRENDAELSCEFDCLHWQP